MRRKLQKLKNSLFSNIPFEIVEDMGLKAGDKLDFCIEGNYIKAIPVHASSKMNVQAAQHPGISEGEGID